MMQVLAFQQGIMEIYGDTSWNGDGMQSVMFLSKYKKILFLFVWKYITFIFLNLSTKIIYFEIFKAKEFNSFEASFLKISFNVIYCSVTLKFTSLMVIIISVIFRM